MKFGSPQKMSAGRSQRVTFWHLEVNALGHWLASAPSLWSRVQCVRCWRLRERRHLHLTFLCWEPGHSLGPELLMTRFKKKNRLWNLDLGRQLPAPPPAGRAQCHCHRHPRGRERPLLPAPAPPRPWEGEPGIHYSKYTRSIAASEPEAAGEARRGRRGSPAGPPHAPHTQSAGPRPARRSSASGSDCSPAAPAGGHAALGGWRTRGAHMPSSRQGSSVIPLEPPTYLL